MAGKGQVSLTDEQMTSILEAADNDEQRLELKKRLGKATVEEQLTGAGNIVDGSSEKTKDRKYVTTPNVTVGDHGARGVYLRAEIARATAEEILRVCDENDL